MTFFKTPTIIGKSNLTSSSRKNDMESFIEEGENLNIRRQMSLRDEELRKKDVLHMIRRREEESRKIFNNQKEFDKITRQMKEALNTRSASSKTRTKSKNVKKKSVSGTRKR